MDRTRLEIAPGLWLDARRAVWLAEQRVLAVADLHLGYAWAHRLSGNLLPITAQDDTVNRLSALVDQYQPRELVVLGDIVHRAVPLVAMEQELKRLTGDLGERTHVRLITGNHDEKLDSLLQQWEIPARLVSFFDTGPHLLLHGDAAAEDADRQFDSVRTRGGRIFMGHEHPAIRIGDGVASAKCPCFLVSDHVIILPAFSLWAAGSNIRRGQFMSPLARQAQWRRAVAILAGKLLPIPLAR